MNGFHRPTVVTVLILVLALFVAYHLTLGRKKSA